MALLQLTIISNPKTMKQESTVNLHTRLALNISQVPPFIQFFTPSAPRTDTADSPCEGAAAASAGVPVTDVTEKGDPVEGDKSSVSKHLCRNCGIDPIESHPESKPDIRPHPQQQALVERRSVSCCLSFHTLLIY